MPEISVSGRFRRLSGWHGDYLFLLENLILKDFRTRYRNMSLGVFWSLLNPLVMMTVLWFIFTKIFPNNSTPHFAAFVLCGLVPYNFFSLAWVTATTSLVDNAGLIKRVPVPREIIPISAVLGNCIHLLIQIVLLILVVFASGKGVNRFWLLLPVVWGCEVIFVCGIGLISASLNVYIRDMRYVVESANTILFWLVPIFYSPTVIPAAYRDIYQYNPLAALIWASRYILLEATAPPRSLLIKLAFSSTLMFALGWWMFQRLRRGFYNHL